MKLIEISASFLCSKERSDYMKYYVTHDLTGKQKAKIKEKGLFTYDLRLNGNWYSS